MTEIRRQRPVRRSVIVVATALVVLAVTLVILQSRFRLEASGMPAAQLAAPFAVAGPSAVPEVAIETGTVESAATVAAPDDLAASPTFRIVVLPARIEEPAPGAQALIDAVQRAMLDELTGSPSVEELIVVSPGEFAGIVPPNAGALRDDPVVYLALARRYGSTHVVEISGQAAASNPGLSLQLQLQHNRPSGWSGSGAMVSSGGESRNNSRDPYHVGVEFAARVISRAVQHAEQSFTSLTDDALSRLRDATLPDEERLNALAGLRSRGIDAEALAAAIELATQSQSAQTRRIALVVLRDGVYDPALTEPVSYLLVSDADPTVRREAAVALARYIESSGSAKSALEYAAASDESAEVRLAAQMAMMDRDAQQAFKRATLLDSSLTPADRLAPMALFSDGPLLPMLGSRAGDPGLEQEALAYAQIVADSDDIAIKTQALQLMNRSTMARFPVNDMRPEIIEVLLASVQIDDETIRRNAVNMLTSQVNDPAVRAALESVLEDDPKLAAQYNLESALERARP